MSDDLRRVADELAIRNILARLAHLADEGDLNEYISLFAEDASWGFIAPPGEAPKIAPKKGRADILAGAQERRRAGTQGPGTHTRHVLSTSWVRVEGDTATSGSHMIFYRNCATAPEVVNLTVYADRFVRKADGWKLADRQIRLG
jgi:3-phenylpropionate/cinnamic acid dioxygenase small subunit